MRWTCNTCGAEHDNLPLDWAYDEPLYWDGGRDPADYLSSDLCRWTDDDGQASFFIRGVLSIPIRELDDTFRYGVWSSLSEASFFRALDLWDDESRTQEPAYFGWLSNRIPGYPDTINLPLDVLTDSLEQRPRLVLRESDHPLAVEQRHGITPERLLELIELNLHTGC